MANNKIESANMLSDGYRDYMDGTNNFIKMYQEITTYLISLPFQYDTYNFAKVLCNSYQT
jgi:hypothetical protein